MEEEKSENSDLFSVKNIIIGLLTVLLLPIPISLIISSGNWLSFIDGNSTVWIGFWGSYLGGIIGTIGVIYVAHLQNKEQRDSLEIIERDNMKRLRIQTILDLLENYNKDVNKLSNEVVDIQTKIKKIVELVLNLDIMNLETMSENYNPNTISTLEKDISAERQKLIEMDIPSGYIVTKLGDIEYKNILLSSCDINLKQRLTGEEAKYYDQIINHLCSSEYNHFHFIEMIKESQRDDNKNFEKVSTWLQGEKMKTYIASGNFLHKLK